MSQIDTSRIEWQIESMSDDGATVTLTAAPVPRIIPDGVRVEVTALSHRERDGDAVRAVVRLTPAVTGPGRDGFRFGSTMSDASAYAHTNTRTHPVYNGAGQVMQDESGDARSRRSTYCERDSGYRLGGILAGTLPGKSGDTFRAVMASAAEFAQDHAPNAWLAAEVLSARSNLEHAERKRDEAQAKVNRIANEVSSAVQALTEAKGN